MWILHVEYNPYKPASPCIADLLKGQRTPPKLGKVGPFENRSRAENAAIELMSARADIRVIEVKMTAPYAGEIG